METTLFQVGKKAMVLKLIQDLIYGFYIELVRIFDINQEIFNVHHNKNIMFFNKNRVDIALKTSQSIKKAKKHYLIFEMPILCSKNNSLFVPFSNFHLMIGAGQI